LITCKRINKGNNANHYVKLGKKKQESSERNYHIISQRVTVNAIIINSSSLLIVTLFSLKRQDQVLEQYQKKRWYGGRVRHFLVDT